MEGILTCLPPKDCEYQPCKTISFYFSDGGSFFRTNARTNHDGCCRTLVSIRPVQTTRLFHDFQYVSLISWASQLIHLPSRGPNIMKVPWAVPSVSTLRLKRWNSPKQPSECPVRVFSVGSWLVWKDMNFEYFSSTCCRVLLRIRCTKASTVTTKRRKTAVSLAKRNVWRAGRRMIRCAPN